MPDTTATTIFTSEYEENTITDGQTSIHTTEHITTVASTMKTSESKKGLPLGATIGIAVGSVVVVTVIIILILFCLRRKRKMKQRNRRTNILPYPDTIQGPIEPEQIPTSPEPYPMNTEVSHRPLPVTRPLPKPISSDAPNVDKIDNMAGCNKETPHSPSPQSQVENIRTSVPGCVKEDKSHYENIRNRCGKKTEEGGEFIPPPQLCNTRGKSYVNTGPDKNKHNPELQLNVSDIVTTSKNKQSFLKQEVPHPVVVENHQSESQYVNIGKNCEQENPDISPEANIKKYVNIGEWLQNDLPRSAEDSHARAKHRLSIDIMPETFE